MATVRHATISDPDIHEPRGVATAGLGRVYISNGAGSGEWVQIRNTDGILTIQPYGIASATEGQTYVASGDSVGSWAYIRDIVTHKLSDISTAGTTYLPLPYDGVLEKVFWVISGAITAADSTITFKINDTALTDGVITVPYATSAAGLVGTITPTAANDFTSTDYMKIVKGGESTGSVDITLMMVFTRSS